MADSVCTGQTHDVYSLAHLDSRQKHCDALNFVSQKSCQIASTSCTFWCYYLLPLRNLGFCCILSLF